MRKRGSGGANRRVNGYIALLLYSVAILACESQLRASDMVLTLLAVIRFVGSYFNENKYQGKGDGDVFQYHHPTFLGICFLLLV